jgi:hypothetical protein
MVGGAMVGGAVGGAAVPTRAPAPAAAGANSAAGLSKISPRQLGQATRCPTIAGVAAIGRLQYGHVT